MELVRYLLLYKFGGFYLDLDFVSLNDLSHYQDIVVTEPPDRVCGGALAFRSRSSQTVLMKQNKYTRF